MSIQAIVESDKKHGLHYNHLPADFTKLDDAYSMTNESFEFMEFKQVLHPETKFYANAYFFWKDDTFTWGYALIYNCKTKQQEVYSFGEEKWLDLYKGRCAMFAGDNS